MIACMHIICDLNAPGKGAVQHNNNMYGQGSPHYVIHPVCGTFVAVYTYSQLIIIIRLCQNKLILTQLHDQVHNYYCLIIVHVPGGMICIMCTASMGRPVHNRTKTENHNVKKTT